MALLQLKQNRIEAAENEVRSCGKGTEADEIKDVFSKTKSRGVSFRVPSESSTELSI